MSNGFQIRGLARPPSGQNPIRRIIPRRAPQKTPFRERMRAVAERLRARGWKLLLRDAFLICAGLGTSYLLFLWFTLPDISDPRNLIAAQSSSIVDRNGTELYRLFQQEDRTFIPGTQIPQDMKNAIIAIEDERFYDRGCLDVQALARVLFRFGQAGGASTLTRQLARNALNLNRENLISRKLKELILGCTLEHRYSKDQLLELYLNWIPFGQSIYGLEQASRYYLGASAKELTLAQSAVLAALPQRPTYFSPYGSHVHTQVTDSAMERIVEGDATEQSDLRDDEVRVGLLGGYVGTGATVFYVGGRTDQVLSNMRDLDFITEEQHQSALAELKQMTFQRVREDIRAPHFVLWVKQQVEEMFTSTSAAEEGILNEGGLTIETTLNWDLQQAAEQAVGSRIEDLAKYGIYNASLVAADPKTGEILAYVGNADYADEEHDGKVDMARAPRQPGSSFKPIVYAGAFEKGYSPATILYDVPTKLGDDEPQNFDGLFGGLMTIRRALGSSRNIPAAKAFFLAGGEDAVLKLAGRLGAGTPQESKKNILEERSDFQYGWPLALGAAETPMTEMVQAYSTFADGGIHKPLISIRKITDRFGNLVPCPICLEGREEEGAQVLDPRIAYSITSVLSDVSARPNEYWQTVLSVPGYQSAAKTGTSNKCLERKEVEVTETEDGEGITGACLKRRPDNLWTIGYTPGLVAGVWAGNADSTALSEKAESLTNAAPIWKDFMVRAHKILTEVPAAFPVPEGMVQPQISLLSGELPTECTPVNMRRGDVFLEERAPKQADPACVTLVVDKVTGLLASDECPVEAREEKSFLLPQSILADRFPAWHQAVLDWAKANSNSGAMLPLPLAPTEQCTLALTPGRGEKPTLTIDFPRDGGIASYPSFKPQLTIRAAAGVREVRYEIDDRTVATAGSGTALEPPLRVPRSIDEDGNHVLRVTVTDTYFNDVTEEVTFRFGEDQSGPSVRFISPASDAIITSGGDLHLEADAEDAEGGVKYVEFFLDDKLLSRKPRAPYELVYPADLKPGTYTLRAVATDLAGRVAVDERIITVEP